MNTYWCELIYKGFVKESFFRQGDSLDDVSNSLDMYQWPKGIWRIELAHKAEE
jgi:hypothetical protein